MNVFFQYWQWYFIIQPRKLLEAWRNFLVFSLDFFSVHYLLKTFFAPWHRYYTSYGRGFDIKVWADAFLSNIIFRGLGAFIRTIIIILGVLFSILVFVIGLIAFLGWLMLPFILFAVFTFGIKMVLV